MAKYNQLTEFERERISKMLAAGCSYTEIAAFLGRSIPTVGREVYRNCAAGSPTTEVKRFLSTKSLLLTPKCRSISATHIAHGKKAQMKTPMD